MTAAAVKRRAKAQTVAFSDVWSRCPFRSLLGVGNDPVEMTKRLAGAFAIVGPGAPKAVPPETLAEIVTAISTGRTYLLLSDDRQQRDRAKRAILAIAFEAGGHA